LFLGHIEEVETRYGQPFHNTGLKDYKAAAISFTGIR
jgi:hypothetical protein